jgi:hypothetical protein
MKKNLLTKYYLLSYVIMIILTIIVNTNCEKFSKIRELLQKSKDQFESEIKHFENQEELEESKILKEILAKPLLSINYHSTITEYQGIKYESIQKFINHLIKIYGIDTNRESVEEGIKDLFLSSSNDIVVDKILINQAHRRSTFLCFLGEKINSEKTSNWVVIELNMNFFLENLVSLVKTKDTTLFGLLEFEKTTQISEIGKMSPKELDLLFQYFQLISLQRALEYFNLTSN